MTLTVKIPQDVGKTIPDKQTLAEAGAAGLCNLIIEHLRARNARALHAAGMPRSNYWGEAADSAQTEAVGDHFAVSVSKEGVVLRYYGGVILPGPGKKALAFPVNPAVAGMRAAEYDPGKEKLELVPGKKGHAPTLRDVKSGEVYYVLIPSKRFNADRTVLPTESAMYDAARTEMEFAMEVL